MTRATALRRIVGIIAAALAIATTAGSASARTFEFNSHGSLVQHPAPNISPPTAAGNVDWGYIAIAASAAALVLTGATVAATTSRRHTQHDNARHAPTTR
jgi:hypothetical protein